MNPEYCFLTGGFDKDHMCSLILVYTTWIFLFTYKAKKYFFSNKY